MLSAMAPVFLIVAEFRGRQALLPCRPASLGCLTALSAWLFAFVCVTSPCSASWILQWPLPVTTRPNKAGGRCHFSAYFNMMFMITTHTSLTTGIRTCNFTVHHFMSRKRNFIKHLWRVWCYFIRPKSYEQLLLTQALVNLAFLVTLVYVFFECLHFK